MSTDPEEYLAAFGEAWAPAATRQNPPAHGGYAGQPFVDFDWADEPTQPAVALPPRRLPATKCQCGLGPDGGVHSDYCPLRGQASSGHHTKVPDAPPSRRRGC